MNIIKTINLLKCLILIIFIQMICIHGFPKNPGTSKKKVSKNMGNIAHSRNTTAEQSKEIDSHVPTVLTVKINRILKPFERVAVTGNNHEIGNWQVQDAQLLHRKSIQDEHEIWSLTLKTPIHHSIQYRYFIARLDNGSGFHVEEWETHLEPRITVGQNKLDEYGVINDTYNIDKGWLTGESVVQLKFYRNPFDCDRLRRKSRVGIKIIPMSSETLNAIDNIGFREINEDYYQKVKIEVTTFNYNDSQLKPQNQNGEVYDENDIIIYHITVRNFNEIGYLVHLSTVYNDTRRTPLGYQAILPSELKGSEGVLQIPIISQSELKPVGFMKIRYLIIKPYPNAKHLTTRTTFAHYWEPSWNSLDIGHRGLGSSFRYLPKQQPPTIENTIAGFKRSIENGADMVEFDVHLTKDLVPIVYHDFYVNVSFGSASPSTVHQLTSIAINDLTYEQLKDLKVYHVVNNSIIFEYLSHNQEMRVDDRLFPTLQDVFEKIDKSIGLNIEIKWPQEFLNGAVEGLQTIDKNRFVDNILLTLLEKGGCGRLVFMSSFDADICTLIRFKQNMYPVLLLILANNQTDSYYEDPRGNTMQNAVCNVQAFNMLGVIGHTGNYISDSRQVRLGTDLNQIVLAWGLHANSTSNIRKLRRTGLHGVIYDRVDLFCEKNESIFNTDEYRNLFKQQCL